MMHAFFPWITRHPGLFWLSTAAVGMLVLAIQQLFVPEGRTFYLFPYPTWNPLSWFRTLALVFRVFPLLVTGLVLVPLGALLLSPIARLLRST